MVFLISHCIVAKNSPYIYYPISSYNSFSLFSHKMKIRASPKPELLVFVLKRHPSVLFQCIILIKKIPADWEILVPGYDLDVLGFKSLFKKLICFKSVRWKIQNLICPIQILISSYQLFLLNEEISISIRSPQICCNFLLFIKNLILNKCSQTKSL